MESVKGTVCEIIYANEENGYTVCEIMDGEESFVAVGCLPFLNIGDKLLMQGEWTLHLEYGEQFKIASYERTMPEAEEEILLYLSSGAIKGIKSATAKRIVDMFGENTLEIIKNEPEKLGRIKGISADKAIAIHNQYIKQISVQKIIAFFTANGLSTNLAYKVYKAFGAEALEKIKENPYIICDIDEIGFKTADRLAYSMDFDMLSPERTDAATLYCLSRAAAVGHTFLPSEMLCNAVSELTGTDAESAEARIINLVINGKLRRRVVNETDGIYLPAYYIAEDYTAKYLKSTANEASKTGKICPETDGITLSAEQEQAVLCAMKNKCMVLTGGPGTGKTTVIKSMLNIFGEKNLSVQLAAPTGRAAKRMTNMCGTEAKTIHRLLEVEYSGEGGRNVFKKNADNKIKADVVIIDEMSMVDIILFYHLLCALPEKCKLILVGDCDQLPSVGAGNVLKDIINSGIIETVYLKEIFRQAKESMIVVNAHGINRGEYPVCNGDGTDFFHIKRTEQGSGAEEIIRLCKERLPKFTGQNLYEGIQVISPTKRGVLGTVSLNNRLQEVFNPPGDKKEIKRRDFVIREGDKVMQIRNNYDIEWKIGSKAGSGVFNGDIGIVKSIKKDEIEILFDGEREVCYPKDYIDELELSYAITVHKSQGSEFPVVVMPMYPCHKNLMSRNLFYTAVTRAKQTVVLVGREDVIKYMTENNYETQRYSGLCGLLRGEELA